MQVIGHFNEVVDRPGDLKSKTCGCELNEPEAEVASVGIVIVGLDVAKAVRGDRASTGQNHRHWGPRYRTRPKVDGANALRRFFHVTLPALMFTQTPKSQTLPIIVASFTSDFTISFSFINAAGVLAVIPPVILALIFERYIVSGLTAGAVKG